MTKIHRFPLFLFALLIFIIAPFHIAADEPERNCATYYPGIFAESPACVAGDKLHICQYNFPDPNFYDYMSRYITEQNSGYLTPAEVGAITKVDLSVYKDILSLEGIQYLFNLEKLYCVGQKLTTLNLSHNTKLTFIDCNNNSLTQLILGNQPNLLTLSCQKNKLTELDVSGCSILDVLSCSDNKIEALNIDQCSTLTYLDCSKTSLSTLILNNHPMLEKLYCKETNIQYLDLRNCPSLEHVSHKSVQIILPLHPNDPDFAPTPHAYSPAYPSLAGALNQIDLNQIIGSEHTPNVIEVYTVNPVNPNTTLLKDRCLYDPATGILTIPSPFDAKNVYFSCKYSVFDSLSNETYLVLQYFSMECSHVFDEPSCLIDRYDCKFCPYWIRPNSVAHTWLPATDTTPKICSVCGTSKGHPLEHVFQEATCTEPATCKYCTKVKGDTLPHTWLAATATKPKTCSSCGLTEGHPLEHVWKPATYTEPEICEYCSKTRGEPMPHEHKWSEATCYSPKTCTICFRKDGPPNPHISITTDPCATRSVCKVCGQPVGIIPSHQWEGPTLFSPQVCQLCHKTGLPALLGQMVLPIVIVIDLIYLTLAICWIRHFRKIKVYPDVKPKNEKNT